MKIKEINFETTTIFSPILVVGFKGFPVNRFTSQVFNSRGEVFDKYFISTDDDIDKVIAQGKEKLKEAMAFETYSHIPK